MTSTRSRSEAFPLAHVVETSRIKSPTKGYNNPDVLDNRIQYLLSSYTKGIVYYTLNGASASAFD